MPDNMKKSQLVEDVYRLGTYIVHDHHDVEVEVGPGPDTRTANSEFKWGLVRCTKHF